MLTTLGSAMEIRGIGMVIGTETRIGTGLGMGTGIGTEIGTVTHGMDSFGLSSTSQVSLNIGGYYYYTTNATLCKVPLPRLPPGLLFPIPEKTRKMIKKF
jgi:hypothetical protein